MPGLTFDTAALIAIERGDPRLQALLDEAALADTTIAVPAGVIAQAWRGSARQARLARFLSLPNVEAEALDDFRARAAGVLCGRSGTADVVDASVVVCARTRGHTVVTSDPGDLTRLDSQLQFVTL